jgi:hypothetical protein
MVDDLDNRTVIDFATNKLGDLCVDFLINSNCCVLNGRTSGQNDYTFIQTTGHSVVDMRGFQNLQVWIFFQPQIYLQNII